MADIGSEETARMDVVYEKERVTIHPTQYGSGRISGKLRLYLQLGSLFLSWEPNEGVNSFSTSSVTAEIEKYRSLYTIQALPLSDVRFIRRHTPTFGLEYIIIVLSSGLAFPPFYFYNGGIRELFATLKQHVFIIRSDDDPNVFLVNDFEDPLQKSLSSLELPGVATVANAMSRQNSFSFTGSVSEVRHGDDAKYGGPSTMSEYGSKQRRKSNDPGRDISFQVLEKFSLVTKFARETTSSLFRENHSSGSHAYGRQKQEYVLDNRASDKYTDQLITPNDASLTSDSVESDESLLVWGKKRGKPLSVEEVWKFLLGYHEYDSTQAEREYLAAMKQEEYEAIKSQWKVRTDRSVPYYEGDDNPNVVVLRDILLTYSFYNFDLGYCQGMSDFLAPILYVMEDESEAFWCFASLMERLGGNFNRDQNGMHAQLLGLSKLVELLDPSLHNYFRQNDCLNYFFCFRWVLIQFKRYRLRIIGEGMDFDTLLKFINELSGQINIDRAIQDAEALCTIAGEAGADCIPPGTPPSMPIETDGGLLQSPESDPHSCGPAYMTFQDKFKLKIACGLSHCIPQFSLTENYGTETSTI
ncbi:unnamed protein product [Triticum turgidum subsp. durum]|uniref:Rab-GAP TBC domain-containing protein n=1 Tax=Triticum turgidum subsp. durum TaxID=4567 RepID=A0A9R1BCT4_TRITD|nr:unnamed protein product [Triticum turgidum subsp. durum]